MSESKEENSELDISPLHITESGKVASQVKAAVDELISFSHLYIEKQGIELAGQKPEDVKKELNKVLKLIEDKQICFRQKAHALLCKGKALNVLPHFSSDALDALSKAVKLEPNNVEAWNELGECYARKKEYNEAVKCFTSALSREENKVSLRMLSQALRQVGATPEEKEKAIVESVDKAKAAVQLDVKDGVSWECLGTAYLALFFTQQTLTGLLKQSLQAYSQAEQDVVCKHHSDLWYNRGMIHLYEEGYQEALEHFHKSHLLEPGWACPMEKVESILAYLRKVSSLVAERGKLRVKKVRSLLGQLSESSLGPYAGGRYTVAGGESTRLECVPLEALRAGRNEERVVVGKVVATVPGDMVPFTFCLMDRRETCLSVTVYNFAEGRGVIIGDSVAVPEPYLNTVSVDFNGHRYQYRNILVHVPIVLVVNGRKLGREKMAYAQFTIDTRENGDDK